MLNNRTSGDASSTNILCPRSTGAPPVSHSCMILGISADSFMRVRWKLKMAVSSELGRKAHLCKKKRQTNETFGGFFLGHDCFCLYPTWAGTLSSKFFKGRLQSLPACPRYESKPASFVDPFN